MTGRENPSDSIFFPRGEIETAISSSVFFLKSPGNFCLSVTWHHSEILLRTDDKRNYPDITRGQVWLTIFIQCKARLNFSNLILLSYFLKMI